MNDVGEVTPIDRPLMRSDLDAVRVAVQNIQQLAVAHYSEAKSTRSEIRLLTLVCVGSAIFIFGCAMAGVIP